ncbi:MAG: hypothetical protein ACK4SF_15975 [Algoriphagus aquaeductus]|uniref:Uncharacterized protein n=1 Tax=Algoriphagus aquaeductus TaxID=475299 RepID=A0A326RMP6_9BACT|nr:hypothetical protein [Algoriphagus aquaeductus]PZV77148.1 hypothetical protein CLV31_12120 [Algoriphagus aquaeductus]
MKRQRLAILLLTNWLLGLLLIFCFPTQVQATENEKGFYILDEGGSNLAESIQLPEAPSFDLDLKTPFHSVQYLFHWEQIPVCVQMLHPQRHDHQPLFDVKSTFIHFFYTW